MGHKLPLASSPLRQLFDVADVVAIAEGRQPVPEFGLAIRNARRTIAGNKAVRSVVSFAVRANDDLVLMQIGARGGHKVLWVFGPIGRNARLV